MDDPKLVAEKRSKFGSAESRRLRRAGRVPGVVYGHGEETIGFSAPADAVDRAVHSGHKVVDLDLDGSTEKAMFRDVQWDTFGSQVLHVDLIRVSRGEQVEVEIEIELHGNAPGAQTGVLEQPLRTLQIACPALQIPEKIEVNVNHLEFGDSILVSQLEVADNVTVLTPPEQVVVQVAAAVEAPEPTDDVGGPIEPEVIGRSKDEEGDADG